MLLLESNKNVFCGVEALSIKLVELVAVAVVLTNVDVCLAKFTWPNAGAENEITPKSMGCVVVAVVGVSNFSSFVTLTWL